MTTTESAKNTRIQKWWQPEYGFFGEFYIEGDDSLEGYLQEKTQNLAERTATEVEGICNVLDLKGGESLLDLPCGYGRHSIALAKKGLNVIGCDINPTHLKKAQKASYEEDAEVSWVQGNMQNAKFPEKFDAIINMFYSFGFFETDDENT